MALAPFFVRLLPGLAVAEHFRAPCVPLDVATPYQSTWSCFDNLTDGSPQHWTGDSLDWVGLVRVGSTVYRWLGRPVMDLPAAQQTAVDIRPTLTRYHFQVGSVQLTVDFMTPSFDHDKVLVVASCPITTVNFTITGTDDPVEVYFDMSATTATKSDDQEAGGMALILGRVWPYSACVDQAIRLGTVEQHLVGQTSDRSDWGYRYLATDSTSETFISSATLARSAFVHRNYSKLQETFRERARFFGCLNMNVSTSTSNRFYLMFDEVISQRYFGRDLMPLWHRNGRAIRALEAAHQWAEQRRRDAEDFDQRLLAELAQAAGPRYAQLGALVYRQAGVMGSTSTAWNEKTGEAWPFMKEISSDGDVSTVDVIFPAFPLFLHVAPEFFRKLLVPLSAGREGLRSGAGLDVKYNLSWAPHHLGTWPVCDLKSEQQEQMPVEESGNMLIMIAALAQKQGSGSTAWLKSYWPVLVTWADFLVASLPDPGKQLCTDDFEGPNPHNINLAPLVSMKT
ncbi:Glutaminase A [Durusdinium trenchii]|uniref:Glutaminase A n=1 Tax=Durusdinium trenchii TaxID=1381693 RepID=A0ABP0L3G1_9DINO